MNKMSLIALLGATAIGLAGCGGHSNTTNTTTTTTTNTTAAAPAAPADGNSAAGGEQAASGGDTQSGGAEHNQNFTLVNHSGHTLVTLQVSPSDSTQWGSDILGRDTLANGESADVSFPRGTEQCNWDIRATYDDNDTTDQRGVNLCETTSVTITGQ